MAKNISSCALADTQPDVNKNKRQGETVDVASKNAWKMFDIGEYSWIYGIGQLLGVLPTDRVSIVSTNIPIADLPCVVSDERCR